MTSFSLLIIATALGAASSSNAERHAKRRHIPPAERATTDASFACSDAATRDEKLICSDAHLRHLDRSLARTFHRAESHLKGTPSLARLVTAQREWLKARSSCGAAERNDVGAMACLEEHYQRRFAEVESTLRLSPPGSGLVARQLHYCGMHLDVDASWPELWGIKGSAGFNASFARRATSLLQECLEDTRATFDEESGAPDESPDHDSSHRDNIERRFSIPFASRRLVTVVMYTSRYGAGAAHPNYATTSATWDLARGRALKWEDVFVRDALPLIARLAAAELARWDPETLESPARIQQGIAELTPHIERWTFLADEAVFTFPPYAIGPFSAGEITVRFPWSALSPILVKGGPFPP